MAAIIESVPNFSEGISRATLEELAAIPGAGVYLLDYSADADHNRSVYTLAGAGQPLVNTLLRMLECAISRIDMNRQRGAHPRIGALDVAPFIPLGASTFDDCEDWAREFARQAYSQLGMPSFYYGEIAAADASKKSLPQVRGKGYEDLPRRLAAAEISLDTGTRLHPTAGAMAVGVRDFLIAYNVNLASEDLSFAQEIATLIRERDGGLPGVRALGLALPSQGMVQVSVNIVDSRRTSIYQVYQRIAQAAAARQVEVAASEFIGMIPARAAQASLQEALRAPSAPILEDKILALI